MEHHDPPATTGSMVAVTDALEAGRPISPQLTPAINTKIYDILSTSYLNEIALPMAKEYRNTSPTGSPSPRSSAV